MTNQEFAISYHEIGLLALPKKKGQKRPLVEWKHFSKDKRPQPIDIEYKYDWTHGICVLCGNASNNLEVLDFDNKTELSVDKTLKTFLDLVYNDDKNLPIKLIIIKTPSGGFHIPYFAENIEGNQKLAMSKDDLVIIETRGEGGLIVTYPTTGYEIYHGSTQFPLTDIPYLTKEERNTLIRVAKCFNEKIDDAKEKDVKKTTLVGKSPFDDFNERGNALSLLESYGIKKAGQKGDVTILKRDGSSQHSGYYFNITNIMFLYTTSTIFEAEKGYNQSQILAKLKFNDDFKETFKYLLKEGYGDAEFKHSNALMSSQPTKTGETQKPYFELAYEFREKKEAEKLAKKEKENLSKVKNLLELYKPTNYDVKPENADPILFYQKASKAILRQGEICVISGQAGSRKTTVVNALISIMLNQKVSYLEFSMQNTTNRKKVYRIETEQSKQTDYERTMQIKENAKINNLDNLVSYNVTDIAASLLRAFLEKIIEQKADEIFCLVLDGAMDFLLNPNDLAESQEFILLLKKIMRKGITVFLVMHDNEGAFEKMVGHLGSYLKRKAEAHFVVQKDFEDKKASFLKVKKMRNVNEAQFADIRFELIDGVPLSCVDDF